MENPQQFGQEMTASLEDLGEMIRECVDFARQLAQNSRDDGGPYWLHGQLESYLIPHLEAWIESEHQAGSIRSLVDSLYNELSQEIAGR